VKNAKLAAELEVANSIKKDQQAIESQQSELSLLKFSIEDDMKKVAAERDSLSASMKKYLGDKAKFE